MNALSQNCRELQQPHRRPGRPGAGQHRGAVPGLERRVHVEPGGALADYAVVPGRRRHAADQEPAKDLRAVAAGRLGDHGQADAESRRPLRPADRCLRQRRCARAVPRGRTPRRHEQHRPAAGLRLPADRSNGGARRIRAVLHRRHGQHLGPHAIVESAGRRRGVSTTAAPTSPRTRSTGRCRPTTRRSPGSARPRTCRGACRQDINNGIADPNAQIPYSHQGSFGLQRQLGSTRWPSRWTTTSSAAGTSTTSTTST